MATAAKLAGEAFAVYSQWSGRKRLPLSNRIAELLEASVAEIVVRASLDAALPVARLQGELMGRVFNCGNMPGRRERTACRPRIDHPDPNRQPQPKPDLRSLLVPLARWRFLARAIPPGLFRCGRDTASALAAGCPVMVKAHPAHPGLPNWLAGWTIVRARMGRAGGNFFTVV